jgi:hypothetical protein
VPPKTVNAVEFAGVLAIANTALNVFRDIVLVVGLLLGLLTTSNKSVLASVFVAGSSEVLMSVLDIIMRQGKLYLQRQRQSFSSNERLLKFRIVFFQPGHLEWLLQRFHQLKKLR